jgi:hypothetical protein
MAHPQGAWLTRLSKKSAPEKKGYGKQGTLVASLFVLQTVIDKLKSFDKCKTRIEKRIETLRNALADNPASG